MTNESKNGFKNRLTRKRIDESSLIKDAREVNLENTAVHLGITPEESEKILDRLYDWENAKKPN